MNAGTITAVLNFDASNSSSGIQSAQQQLNTFSDSAQSAGTRIQALGGTLTSYGSMLTKNISLPRCWHIYLYKIIFYFLFLK